VVPLSHVLMAVAPALAALLVCLTSPTGFDGLDEFAALAYATGLYLAVRGWAVDGARRRLVLVAVALAGLEQFAQAYLAWWGGGVVSRMMVGTFSWHNPFAAYMVGTGIVAVVLAVRARGRARLVGWVVAPWLLAALAFAGSRAALGAFALGYVIVVVLAFMDRRGRIGVLAVVAAAWAVAAVLASPLLMENPGAVTRTFADREASQSLEGNGQARLVLWRAAWELGRSHPFTGAGFDSFAGAGSVHVPAETTMSSFAHNGYLQAFSDGGTVLLVAITAATALPLIGGARAVVRRRRGTSDVEAVAATAGMIGLVLHSGVDFDWSYPSLVALFAILAALVPGRTGTTAVRSDRTGRAAGTWATRTVWGGVALLLVVALPASARGSGLAYPALEPPAWVSAADLGVPTSAHLAWLPAMSPCRSELGTVQRQVVERALTCTASAARDDPALAVSRARAYVVLGQESVGLRIAADEIAEWGSRRPLLRYGYALVLLEAGEVDQAEKEIDRLRAELRARNMTYQQISVEQGLRGLREPWAARFRTSTDRPIPRGDRGTVPSEPATRQGATR